MEDIKEIGEIIFGVLSAKEIIDMSVCKIDTTKLTGPGSVYDERMGSNAETNVDCVTCGLSSKQCSGHFGHIEFNEYIINPLFYKNVVSFLRCFCLSCDRLLITKDEIDLCGINRFKNESKFKKIIEKLEKVDICGHCNCPHPKIKFTPIDNTISKEYKEKILNIEDDDDDEENPKKKKAKKVDTKISIAFSVDEIKKHFDVFLDEDIVLCGFDPNNIHPRNFIMSVFPVIPPCARPFVLADGNICDDDLTNQIIEIIKTNNILKPIDDVIDEKIESKRIKAFQSLKFRVSTFFNNSQGKAKHPTNSRPIKGLKERMTGKEGQIRNNLMGKRVEFSGRTVIGPDPTLKFGELGMPKQIAEDLTYPERVTPYNKEKLSKMVNNGEANFMLTKKKNKEIRVNLKYAMNCKGTELQYNDIVIKGSEKIVIRGSEKNKLQRNGVNLDTHKDYLDEISKNKNSNLIISDSKLIIKHDNIVITGGEEILVTNHNVTLKNGDQLIRNGEILKTLLPTDTIFRKDKKIKDINGFIPRYGDKITRDGKDIPYTSILVYPYNKKIQLNIGDEIHRHTKDGDIVLFNRQPTLHKGSMMAKRVKVLPHKTFRMGLAPTSSYNADFD